jgi:uncharacterized protein
MTLDTAEVLLKKALEEAEEVCGFTFQGGEPTLAGLEFFREFVKLADRQNHKNIKLEYCIQTNGYHLDEEWYPFLKEHNFLVGVSLDGDHALHDHWRKDKEGAGTYQCVLDTIHKLEHHGIPYNILTVVTGTSAKKAE